MSLEHGEMYLPSNTNLVFWQANCPVCGSAYVMVHVVQANARRPLYCVICGATAIFHRLDTEEVKR